MRIKKKQIKEKFNTDELENKADNVVKIASDVKTKFQNLGMSDDEAAGAVADMMNIGSSKVDEASDEHAVSVDATHDMGIIQNIIRSVDNLSQIPVLKNLVDNFKVKHNSEPELGTLVDTLNNQINSIMRQSESEDDEYQTLLRSLNADSKKIENGDEEEPMNDLPFESVKPKMTKNELIESVLNNTSKKRKVIKTISVKNLRNE